MFKSIVLLLLLHTLSCRGIDVSRCCKQNEIVSLSVEDNDVICTPSDISFEIPILLKNGSTTNMFPSFWNMRDYSVPSCPSKHKLEFIIWRNNYEKHIKLQDTGILNIDINDKTPATDLSGPLRFCLAPNGLLVCMFKPYQPMSKTVKKCCGKDHALNIPKCMSTEPQNKTMEEDVENLLNIDKDFFDTNGISVVRDFPYCSDDDHYTYNQAAEFEIQPNASILLDGHYNIPAGEFCIDHDRTYNRDQLTVVACSKHAYSNAGILKINAYCLIFFMCLQSLLKLLL